MNRNPSTRAPKVSVLVPTWNYAGYLPEALDSILAQDFADYEIVVSDDASTDDSAAVLARYAARDPRLRVQIQPKNLGMVANWNWCLQQARGDYVKFLFGDDCFAAPTALRQLVALLDDAPGAVLAASARLVLDAQSRPREVWDEWRHAGRHRGIAVIARCLSEERNLIGEPSAVLFRRTATPRGFDAGLRQIVDQEMWFQVLLHGDFVYTPEVLCAFRQHDSQQTALNRRTHLGPQEGLVVLARYLEAIEHERGAGLASRRYLAFRQLYYFRKHGPYTPELLAIEASLRSRLGRGWYAAFWCWHRVSKPFRNVQRRLRRRLRPAPASSVPLARSHFDVTGMHRRA